jgi:ferredoxin-thioredoxin reductase catalytic subunit
MAKMELEGELIIIERSNPVNLLELDGELLADVIKGMLSIHEDWFGDHYGRCRITIEQIEESDEPT